MKATHRKVFKKFLENEKTEHGFQIVGPRQLRTESARERRHLSPQVAHSLLGAEGRTGKIMFVHPN